MVQYLQLCEKSYSQFPLGGAIRTTILLQILIINTWLNTLCQCILFFFFSIGFKMLAMEMQMVQQRKREKRVNMTISRKEEGKKKVCRRIKIRYNEMSHKIPFIMVLHKRLFELPPNAHVGPFDLGFFKSVTNVIVVILQLWLALLQTLTLTYFMWAC